MHKRKLIRDAIAAALSAAPGLASRVATNRTRPTEAKELPVVLVYTLQEAAERIDLRRTLSRTLTIGIEARTGASGNLDDALDDLCRTIERAMAADPKFAGKALDSALSETSIGLDGDGETRQAIATMTYTVVYLTDAMGG